MPVLLMFQQQEQELVAVLLIEEEFFFNLIYSYFYQTIGISIMKIISIMIKRVIKNTEQTWSLSNEEHETSSFM